jgi:hypothetical protein
MKRTKLSWLYLVLELIFLLVAPCVMMWLQYGDLTHRYKIPVTAILLTLLIFLTFKKILLNKWMKGFELKIANIDSNALSITDPIAIKSNKKAYRNYSILQLFFNSIIPILLMALAVLTIKTVEKGVIKLYGCLMFCLISICIGVIFHIAEIYSMKTAHEKK